METNNTDRADNVYNALLNGEAKVEVHKSKGFLQSRSVTVTSDGNRFDCRLKDLVKKFRQECEEFGNKASEIEKKNNSAPEGTPKEFLNHLVFDFKKLEIAENSQVKSNPSIRNRLSGGRKKELTLLHLSIVQVVNKNMKHVKKWDIFNTKN